MVIRDTGYEILILKNQRKKNELSIHLFFLAVLTFKL